MKSNKEALKKRGYVEETDLYNYLGISKQNLYELLKSNNPRERTIAIRLLVRNQILSPKLSHLLI